MKRFFLPVAVILFAVILSMSLVTCSDDPDPAPAPGNTVVIINDKDPAQFNFWLVHEYYLDTQRLTKMIIDAGNGNAFNAASIDTDTFKVAFEQKHWHNPYPGCDCSVTEAGNLGSGFRIVDRTYVSNASLENIVNQMAKSKHDMYYGQSSVTPTSTSGRYLILEFYTEREWRPEGTVIDNTIDTLNPKILDKYQRAYRTPGGESGWNNHTQFVQHKHTYDVTINKDFIVKSAGMNVTIKKNIDHSFVQTSATYNKNEIFPGYISVLFNLYDKGTWTYSQAGESRTFFDYRFYNAGGSETAKKPLFVWLHGNDGNRITESNWVSNTDPAVLAALQNTGHLSIGSAGVLVSAAIQETYGVSNSNRGFYVLAPQGNNGHNTVQIKALIDDLISKYPIDPERIYIAGHSMGGMATIQLLIENPTFFAAATPSPGSVGAAQNAMPSPENAALLAQTPLWLFAIRGDNTGMCRLTINAYNAIRNAGGDNVRMTYFPVNAGKPDVYPYGPGVPFGFGPGYDYPGNYGYDDDPVLGRITLGAKALGAQGKLVGYDWSHSAYEPLMSNTVTTNFAYNVGTTAPGGGYLTTPATNESHNDFQWGYRNPLDTANDTTFAWIFKQRRIAPAE